MARRRSVIPKKFRPWVAGALVAVVLLGQIFGWFDSPQQTETGDTPGTHEVVRFVDGDTIVVNLGGKHETVRMIGVDTPETRAPDTPVQCYGAAASAYTKNRIGGQRVRLEADPATDNRDRYDRLLRYIYLPDDRLLAEDIIRNGYGFAYTVYPFTKKDVFVAAEETARRAGNGLWGSCLVSEENGRKQTSPAGEQLD